ncbi:MAG: leucine-rich repeat protein [Bacilli bacterium]|nr:leucine-rich repeat protein [Bacilli bacterium]
MPKINNKFYHKIKNSELEDTLGFYKKKNKYENITFAPNVKKIKNFSYSEMLKSIFVPETVDEIEEDSFSNCKKLEEVIFSEGYNSSWKLCF